MTPAARTVFYFSFYLYAVGLTLLFIPNIFLDVLQLPGTNEAWIRLVGVLAICIGFYYHRTALQNNISFIKLTVPTRVFVFISFCTLVLLKFAPPVLAGIGAIDLFGAIWTYTSIRK